MSFNNVKSYAKLNLSLNIVGKSNSLHKIESIFTFISLHDLISIKESKIKNHSVEFYGKFSKNIKKSNTISKLLEVLDSRKLLKNKKFKIRVKKNIPSKAGLGGGSMNAAALIKFFLKKKILKIKKKEILLIAKLVGSDVILGLNSTDSIINSKEIIKEFKNKKKRHVLIVKPNFGCSTKDIYLGVKRFNKPHLIKPNIKMFSDSYLKKMTNSLESIAFIKYPRLKFLKSYMEKLDHLTFVRMTGSGSAIVAYFQTKNASIKAKKNLNKKFKNYWSMLSRTI